MSEVQKIIIFGATGRIGKGILKYSVQKNLEVSVYVRTPSKIPEELQKSVKVIQGDILDKENVEKALEGQSAVLSAIGPPNIFGESNILTDGVANIISGMKKHSIRRLAVLSVEKRYLPGAWRYTLLKPFTIVDDHVRQLSLLEKEKADIDWMAILAPRIVENMTIHPGYLVKKDISPGQHQATHAEVGDFMIKYLTDEETFQKYKQSLVGISSKPTTKWFS